MTKIYSVLGKTFQTAPHPNERGCAGCCFDEVNAGDGHCSMPVELATIVGTLCGVEEIIYKDITDEENKQKI